MSNIDELNCTETKHTHVFECMPGHSCLSSFCGNLLVVYALQYGSTLEKTSQSKVSFKKWNDNEKPKKKLRNTLRKMSWERTGGTVK